MEFNENQKKVIKYGKGPLLVEAGPGSGKTTVIVGRIKYLIDKGVDPESFLVITFTTKVADNLKNKLREKLSNDIVLKMQISTIHSFCLEYLKSKNQTVTLIDDDTSEKKILFINHRQLLNHNRTRSIQPELFIVENFHMTRQVPLVHLCCHWHNVYCRAVPIILVI